MRQYPNSIALDDTIQVVALQIDGQCIGSVGDYGEVAPSLSSGKEQDVVSLCPRDGIKFELIGSPAWITLRGK